MQVGVSAGMSTKSKSPGVHPKPQTRAPVKAARSDRPAAPKDRLGRKMSEVLSLREKVAQAELAAHRYGASAKGDADDTSPISARRNPSS